MYVVVFEIPADAFDEPDDAGVTRVVGPFGRLSDAERWVLDAPRGEGEVYTVMEVDVPAG